VANDDDDGVLHIHRLLRVRETCARHWKLLAEQAKNFVTTHCLDEQLRKAFLKIRNELFCNPQRHLASRYQYIHCATVTFDRAVNVSFHPSPNAIGKVPCSHAIQSNVMPIILNLLANPGNVLDISQNWIGAFI
jgi:hypothetical protein